MKTNEKELCIALAKANTEDEIVSLLKKEGLWDNLENWQFYGGIENNFSIMGNQQNAADASFVEKIINSIDAMLTKECLLKGIAPDSEDAPESIQEACTKFFDIKDGVLYNVRTSERSKLAENICVVATGEKSNPCYHIIDKGEGQIPSQFPETFLSLAKSNKMRIPFVQGKHNMGSTGSLIFCGEKNVQLIISKRCPGIAQKENLEDKECWGFTVIRRDNPQGKERSSSFRYLAPNKKILKFKAENLPLLPEDNESFGKPLEYGTFVKLYEYDLKGYKTNILFDLYNRLALLIPSLALPVRLIERRGYAGHTLETTLSGLTVRLEEDKRENLEYGFPSSAIIVVENQRMNCQIYAFKKLQADKYKKSEGIIFTVNGQTHGSIPETFFQRQNVKMSYIARSILIVLDCTCIQGRAMEKLFMPSRDRLREGALKDAIEERLEQLVREHAGLKALREKRRREEIEGKLQDSKPLEEVLKDIIKKSPSIANLLLPGVRLSDPFHLIETATTKEKFVGKEFPTYFRLNKKKQLTKNCPINCRFRVDFETDAVNDYFEREANPGELTLSLGGAKQQDYVLNLWNGIASLTATLPKESKVGDQLEYTTSVTDPTQFKPFESTFTVIVNKETKANTSKGNGRRQPPGIEEEEKRKVPAGLSLPHVTPVRNEEWQLHDPPFTKETALVIKETGEGGYDFFINLGNIHLLLEIKAKSKTTPKLLEEQFKYAMVLVGLALLKENKEEAIEEKVRQTTTAIAPVILPMISALSELTDEEVGMAEA